MNICVVTSSFPRYKGDYSGFGVYEEALSLSRRHEVHVIYPTDMKAPENPIGPFYHHPLRYPFQTYPLAQVHGLDLLNTFRLLASLAIEIRSVGRKHHIDLFYAFWTIPSAFVCSLFRGEVPFLAQMMGSDSKVFGRAGIARPFIRHTVRQASRIIALSSDLKREAVELGASEDKISVIPGGVDLGTFKPMDKRALRANLGLPDGLILLYVGSLFKLKRVDRIIRVSARLNKEFKFNIVIVGDGPERGTLESLSHSLGVKNILFLGKAPREKMPEFMAASDMLVLLSETEGLPYCVQEAMASHLPIVASNVGGLPDIVANGTTGYLVASEEETEEALRRLMSDPGLRDRLGANARAFAEQHLSVDKSHDRIVHLCESLAMAGSIRAR